MPLTSRESYINDMTPRLDCYDLLIVQQFLYILACLTSSLQKHNVYVCFSSGAWNPGVPQEIDSGPPL